MMLHWKIIDLVHVWLLTGNEFLVGNI